MNQPRDLDAAPEEQGKPKRASDVPLSRRTMLKAGGSAAVPILLTLASNPVSAGGSYNCVIASSFVSATTFKSRNGGSATVSCTTNTWTCDAWHNNAGLSNCDSMLNNSVLTCLGWAGPYSNTTCKSILQQTVNTNGTLGVCQHFISLVNNCDKGWVSSGINKTYLQGAWKEFCLGTFPSSSPAGQKWDATATISWLRVMLGYAW